MNEINQAKLMKRLPFKASDLEEIFPTVFLQQGQEYQQQNKVLEYQVNEISKNHIQVASHVSGSRNTPYQNITDIHAVDEYTVVIQGHCECASSENCKHIVAVLYQLLHDRKQTKRGGDEHHGSKALDLPVKAALKIFAADDLLQHETSTPEYELIPLIELNFHYGKYDLPYREATTLSKVQAKNKTVCIKRNADYEEQVKNNLKEFGLTPITNSLAKHYIKDRYHSCFIIKPNANLKDMLDFRSNTLPKIQKLDYDILIEESFPIRIIPEPIAWYCKINKNTHTHALLELGTKYQRKHINLFPPLKKLIAEHYATLAFSILEHKTLEKNYPIELEPYQYVLLKGKQLRNILLALPQLYEDNCLTKSEQLKLLSIDTTQLLALKIALQSEHINWVDKSNVLEMANELVNLDHSTIDIDSTIIKTDLRPYQKQGVAWVQQLRKLQLGGLLADDMGLGKTLQTLANLAIEKKAGRLSFPSLLIAPTSVSHNWVVETQRFTPNLSILSLQGVGRQNHFPHINDYDVVLTTYPLLLRDEAFYRQQKFYYLILDEAQYINNYQTKTHKILCKIKATHFLALTGTPMENHLGELWSIFRIVLPKLFGSLASYKQNYQNPIEKQNSEQSSKALAQRVSPFLLRRTKQQVIQDLPRKTNITRVIVFAPVQQQLYEKIKLTTEHAIREAIQERGISRSQVLILRALLRLRQCCCDPRLIKQEESDATSAKLDYLVEMLPQFIQEERRILIFSSFTSMLSLIEDELQQLKLPYVTLTGKTKDRQAPVKAFQNHDAPIFLISLKAGGTGLNLTAADVVIHFDPWWNPAIESQATDRAYRIGQDKPVFVYKLIAKDTIEERIIELQERKKESLENLFAMQSPGAYRITPEMIKFLLKRQGD